MGWDPPRLVLLGCHRVASALLADLERLHPDLLAHTMVVDTNAGEAADLLTWGLLAHVLLVVALPALFLERLGSGKASDKEQDRRSGRVGAGVTFGHERGS